MLLLDFLLHLFDLLINFSLFLSQLINLSLCFSYLLLCVFVWWLSNWLWLWLWTARWWWAWGWGWAGRRWGWWLSSFCISALLLLSSPWLLHLSFGSSLFLFFLYLCLHFLSLSLYLISLLLLLLHQSQHLLLFLHLLQHHLFLFLLPSTHNNLLLHSQDLSHIFCQRTQPNRSEIIDWESKIIWMINWEQPLVIFTHLLLVELFFCSFDTKILSNFFKQNFQKHSTSSCCRLWLKNNNLENSPIYGKSEEQVTKQFS